MITTISICTASATCLNVFYEPGHSTLSPAPRPTPRLLTTITLAPHPRPLQVFKCGFPETGEYTYTPEPPEGCPDPFMTTHRAGPSPCGERCCRADHAGDFTAGDAIPGSGAISYTFQPTDNACKYEEIQRGQILHYLHSRGIPILVTGDSMMRQFFLRLVMMIRGQKHLLDYHVHAHGYYAVCPEADVFRLSTSSSNISSMVPNNEHLKSKIPSFFGLRSGPGTLAGQQALSRCSRRPTEFHYLHSPKWKNQVNMVPYYLESLPPGVKPIIFTSVAYWEENAVVPQDYLDMLSNELRYKAHKVFVISVPRIRVVLPERVDAYTVRNAFMRQWVEEQGEPFVFVDFDTLAFSPHTPPGGSNNNWHYMCSLAWRLTCVACDLLQVDHSDGKDAEGLPVAQIPQGNVERIHATEDGMCSDEMNRNMWQIVFNALVKPGKGQTGRRRFMR